MDGISFLLCTDEAIDKDGNVVDLRSSKPLDSKPKVTVRTPLSSHCINLPIAKRTVEQKEKCLNLRKRVWESRPSRVDIPARVILYDAIKDFIEKKYENSGTFFDSSYDCIKDFVTQLKVPSTSKNLYEDVCLYFKIPNDHKGYHYLEKRIALWVKRFKDHVNRMNPLIRAILPKPYYLENMPDLEFHPGISFEQMESILLCNESGLFS